MRLASLTLVIALAACSGGRADDKQHAAGTPRRSSSSVHPACSPDTPTAADGTPASVIARIGDVQIAIVDRGASVDVVSLFRGCDLTPVTIDGTVAALPIGGTVTHGDGLRCDGNRIVVLSATSDDGATYQATATTYQLSGTKLVARGKSVSTFEAQRDSETLRSYYELDC